VARHSERGQFQQCFTSNLGKPRPLLYAQPTAGIMDAAHYIFVTAEATKVGTPADDFEFSRIEWVPLADVPKLIAKQDTPSASTMAALD
jgi:hypothetical protein